MLMTTSVGIFDNAGDLDKSVRRLVRAGFEDTVYDEAIVAEEPRNADSVVFAPGYAPAMVWGNSEANLNPKPDRHARHAIAQAFKAHLADYHLPNDVIEAYVTTFIHNGEFVLVRTDNERTEQVMEILREWGATRVDRHN